MTIVAYTPPATKSKAAPASTGSTPAPPAPGVLSPWPSTPAALANATAILRAAVDPELDDLRVQRLGAVAAALVEQYAPLAPAVLRDEAVQRVAGRLHETPPSSVRSEEVGDVSTGLAPSMTGALLHSGCKSLLFPWRTKRAGVAK